MTELIAVLEKQQVSTKLSLVVLGNLLTHLINSQLPPSQRQTVVDSFIHALQKSVVDEIEH